MRHPPDVALVLLAAGMSRRFGSDDKLLAELDGKALIGHCIKSLGAFDFGERIAVVRDAQSAVAALLSATGYRLVVNPTPETGMGGSLAFGASAIDTSASCLICLADMPLVPRAHIQAILDAEADIVASDVDDVNQPPALFDACHFGALVKLDGEHGARALIRSAQSVTAHYDMLADIDDRGDLIRVEKLLIKSSVIRGG